MPLPKATTATTSAADDEVGVAAVNRALSLLAAFSTERPALTLAQLAGHTGLYKSTILRLAESLEAFGYLARGPTGVFALGPAPLRLAALYRRDLHPAEVVMPVLRELAAATQESAALYVRAGTERLCAYRAGSPRAVSDTVRAGELLPLDKGAGGRVLLAFDAAQPARGARHDEIRRAMFALTLGERSRETAAMACPVFGPDRRLEGALSLSGPIQRFSSSAVATMRTELFAAAGVLTIGLGGDPDLYRHAAPPSKGTHR